MGYFITRKKKIRSIIAFTILFFIFTSSIFFINNDGKRDEKHRFLNAYSIYINDSFVGKVEDAKDILALIGEAKADIEAEFGYTPDYGYKLRLEPSTYSKETDASVDLVNELKLAIKANVAAKTKGYAMKVGSSTIFLASKDDVIEVLTRAQNKYVQDESSISISLEKDPHNPLVIIPKSTILSKELPKERIFVSNAMLSEPDEDMRAPDEEYFHAVVTDLEMDRSVVITESFVSEDKLLTPDSALDFITKENEKEKVYKVVEGDIPETIAMKNDMTVDKLYDLNDGLRENATRIQIGQPLVVMVPEPELTVTTKEKVIYTKKIEHDNDYVSSPDEYVGTHTVIDEGRDGLVEIRAEVEKVNGKVVNTEIFEETTIIEPIRGTLTKGTKRLPITTATGTFEYPVIYFTLTSPFGYRWGRLHKGIDMAGPIGTPILAADGGRVTQAGWDGAYGYSVMIDHGNGYTTKYAHCNQLYVEVGQDVAQYEQIAEIGNTGNSTGPHCHFEIREWGMPRNPMDYLN